MNKKVKITIEEVVTSTVVMDIDEKELGILPSSSEEQIVAAAKKYYQPLADKLISVANNNTKTVSIRDLEMLN